MEVNFHIESEEHLPWQQLSAGWWVGHVYSDRHWLTIAEIEQALSDIQSLEDLKTLLAKWNGHFALLWSVGTVHFAVTDIARSYPVFWNTSPTQTTISARADESSAEISWWQHHKSLVQTEFVPGHATLWHGWQQLQAGEILEVKNNLCYLHNYFPHRRPKPVSTDRQQHSTAFNQVLERIFQRLIAYAKNRPIVVPLSGGYDSRIILAGLHRLGYTNLKAFTYGSPGSEEVQLAEKVAQTLGIDWAFVPYTRELLDQFGDEDWQAFASFAARAVALPQEQDYFALRSLREQGWLPAGSIICPGYCGDFQAGSYLPTPGIPWPPNRKRRLQEKLLARFVRDAKADLRQLWLPLLPQAEIANDEEYISELEHWVLREYVSKYIVNGVRAYEWADCQWHLPLWDREFIEFWQSTPNEWRENMHLYREVLREHWFEPYDIAFAEDQAATTPVFSPGQWLPPQWKKKLKSYLPEQPTTNVNGLEYLIPLIQQQLNWPRTDLSKSVNEMIGHWYHDFLNKKNL